MGSKVVSAEAQPPPIKIRGLPLRLPLETVPVRYSYHVFCANVDPKPGHGLTSLSMTFQCSSLRPQPCAKASEDIGDAGNKSEVAISTARSCPL